MYGKSLRKTGKASPAIALDRIKQSNNANIKRVGSAAVLLSPDMESALRCC